MRGLARLTIATVLLSIGGCPDDQDAPPEADTDAGTDTAADGSGDGVDETGADTECQGPDGCYDCEPVQSEQLLNHCTAADCEPFPNTPERLPLMMPDGSLPPIP